MQQKQLRNRQAQIFLLASFRPSLKFAEITSALENDHQRSNECSCYQYFNNEKDIEQTVTSLKTIVKELRSVSPFKEKYSFDS